MYLIINVFETINKMSGFRKRDLKIFLAFSVQILSLSFIFF